METLTQKIKKYALEEAGFDLAGIAQAELPGTHGRALERWVGKGYAGSMDYMTRPDGKRANPKNVLPGARSVISLAVNYFHPEDEKPGHPAGKVAKYAYGRDYHKLIEKKLKLFSKFIVEKGGAGTEVKSYVDTGPILEKAFAQEAGLGFFGKNTNIITRDFGSWVFLASLITNLELEADAPHAGACGSCRLCIDACPTDALLGNYELDARRCISYLTIESKEEANQELREKIGEWVFGCDICQDVCPYNFRAKTTKHEELYPNKIAGSWIEGEEIQGMSTDEQFSARFQGSPLKRAKLHGLKRNITVVSQHVQ